MFSIDDKLKKELLARNILRKDQLLVVEEELHYTSEPFDEICIKLKFVSSPIIKKILSSITGIPYVNLRNIIIDHAYLQILKTDVQRQYSSIIFFRDSYVTKIAMADPANLSVRDIIKHHLATCSDAMVKNTTLEFFYADKIAINDILNSVIATHSSILSEDIHDVSTLLSFLLQKAIALQASDVHFHPTEHLVHVKARVDGLLRTMHECHYNVWSNLIIRIKVLANLDIAESRRPQSGHFDLTFDNKKFDFRVSFHPTIYGENVVIRILYKNKQIFSFNQLGISPQISDTLLHIIKRPHGLILLCGPTGSGKTTTLYTLCSYMNTSTQNIMTLEEPVEYQFENICQTEINQNGVVNFADGVRSILRQDPDIIFIGEIRDEETAQIALRAAMTGHLVLSTVHSNNALCAPSRLFDLGINPTLLSGQIIAVMSQRLLRRICLGCEGYGCCECGNSGFKGRIAASELLLVNNEIDACISKQKPVIDLTIVAKQNGYKTMEEDAIQKMQEGLTTLDELKRVFGEIHLDKNDFC
ncbi:MAG: GspE/PulE family protein [Holosporales bacterium]|jgi:general secretion pathway protein E/type IV pilus assembly protein PilB|nr:GspE/PulE family protein [Holosporales bacterium]